MFYVRSAFANIWRYRHKSVLNILICILTVLLLNLYLGNLSKSREQLESLPEKIPVEATITNLQGGRESGIFIKEAYYEGVMKAKEVKEPRFTLSVIGGMNGAECSVLAANTWKAITGIHDRMLRFSTGDAEAFFSSDAKECLVRTDFMEEHQLKPGDKITLDLQYFELVDHVDIYARPLERVDLTIAGTLEEEAAGGSEEAALPQVVVPMETLRESYHNQGVKFYVDSGRFHVKNPLKLNDFKEEMKEIGFMEVVSQAQPALEGHALVVRDETFIKASGSLEEGYRAMKNFLPVTCIVLAGTGFITAYLLTNGRRQEYATMRSLGVEKRACTGIYLLEQGVSELVGGMLGTALSVWIVRMKFLWSAIGFTAFFFCFLAGTFVAVIMLGRTSVMEVLAKAD